MGPSVECNCSGPNFVERNPTTNAQHAENVPQIYIVDSEEDMSEFTKENMIVLRRDTRTLHVFSGSGWTRVQVSVLLDKITDKS
ncbi:acetylcholinesterase collagenic tail peptide-like [Astyanax mexicanus]|uniref:Acetylcholinesterase collagenic tail peptide-like n=1 Tax=Astyanax mexicanus TaxID=7994 RepID=A0A8T2KN78_ASTMX|nr:acetylcholinesterase collagenic tail peptide-like [Astyanax mexicanus]